MRKLLLAALLLCGISSATTLTPIQLLNPVGSTSGQAIVSTGAGTAPQWATVSGGSGCTTSGAAILYGNGSGGCSNVTIGSGLTFSGGTLTATGSGTGTVTSVGLTLPAFITVSGSPVTTSGTLTGTLASQTQNLFFASPNGSSGAPTFRAMVAADVPTLNQNTTGNAATVTTNANLTGDVTSVGNTTTLATVGTAGTYGSVTVNAKGLTTSGVVISAVANGGTGVATLTGIAKGNGASAFAAATAGTDYSAGTSALTTGILKSTTSTGALTIATGADLPAMTATVGGAVPTPPNNTTTFLRGDGTFATPAGSGDMVLANVQTVTGAKTFGTIGGAVGKFILAGSTSGSSTLDAQAVAGTTAFTLPSTSDTLIGKATTDTLTNKTYDTAGTGNSFKINGTAITAVSGTGSVCLTTSCTLVTPALGTPASGVATNLTGTASGLTAGNVTTNANLTGPITSSGNATSIASQTGTGTKFVVDTSPTLITPILGVAAATSINKVTITQPATGSTLTVADGSSLITAGAFSTTITATATTNATLPAGTVNLGYLEIPQNSKSADYTTILSDSGKQIYHPGADTTARTFTINSNANVAYPIGTTLTFINDTSAGVVTIAITSDTMILAGAGTTGSRTLAASCLATAVKMTSVRWIISGPSCLT